MVIANQRFVPVYAHGWLVFDLLEQTPASSAGLTWVAAHNLAAVKSFAAREKR